VIIALERAGWIKRSGRLLIDYRFRWGGTDGQMVGNIDRLTVPNTDRAISRLELQSRQESPSLLSQMRTGIRSVSPDLRVLIFFGKRRHYNVCRNATKSDFC
jgi:hypothetical protein